MERINRLITALRRLGLGQKVEFVIQSLSRREAHDYEPIRSVLEPEEYARLMAAR
jgi:hypothetical protein